MWLRGLSYTLQTGEAWRGFLLLLLLVISVEPPLTLINLTADSAQHLPPQAQLPCWEAWADAWFNFQNLGQHITCYAQKRLWAGFRAVAAATRSQWGMPKPFGGSAQSPVIPALGLEGASDFSCPALQDPTAEWCSTDSLLSVWWIGVPKEKLWKDCPKSLSQQ